jgi:hypothetical protein
MLLILSFHSFNPSDLLVSRMWHEVNGRKIYPNLDSIAWGTRPLFSDFERTWWMGRNGRMAVETVLSRDTAADRALAVYHA